MTTAVFFSGITVTTFTAAGIFFLKFWKVSHDRFFLLFASACWLIALERFLILSFGLTMSPITTQMAFKGWVYLMRLLAFIAIFIAVVDKNRKKDTPY